MTLVRAGRAPGAFAPRLPAIGGKAAGVLRFDGALPSSVAYSRTGASARISRSGLISFVGNDVAPISDRGLLIEPARTNLIPGSSAFSAPSSVTVTTGQAAPDGTSGASLLTEDGTNVAHGVDKNVTGITVNAAYALSIFAKRKDFDWCMLVLNDALGQKRANFNLATGAAGATDGGLTVGVLALAGGWKRLHIVGSTGATATQVLNRFRLQRVPGDSATVATTYLGDSASGLYVWEGQTELGAFPTSPIPTTGSAATRGLPTITATAPAGRTKALLSFADASTTLVTGLTAGASFDIASAVVGASKGRFGASELVSLEWQP